MASDDAVRCGIRVGMSLAEAQALLETAVFLLHDENADTAALQMLVGLCYRFSPIVGLEHTSDVCQSTSHCLMLDISGCAHLFGDEPSLARQLVAELGQQGYFAHAGLAHTVGAAWAIACYGHRTGVDRRLRSLPVEALRIPDRLIECLHEFDLRQVGQLKKLPRESLPSRFGTVLTERLDQMYGQREELLVPVSLSEPVSIQWETDDPICHPDAVRYVCEDLLAELLDGLQKQGEGLVRLTLNLESESSAPVSFELGLTKPTDSARHVMSLLDLKLETQPIPEWLTVIRMEASATALLPVRQQKLFDDDRQDDGNVRKLLDRLSARLGQQAVVRPVLLPEAIPEQAVAWASLAGDDTQSARDEGLPKPAFSSPETTGTSIRPLDLYLQPEPVEVMSRVPGGVPVRMLWKHRSYRISRCTSPERISTGWWQDTRTVYRDYYQAETQSGARYWLFRNKDGAWFLHGVFE